MKKSTKKTKIGVYGTPGSYTHQAAIDFFDKHKIKNVSFSYFPFFPDLFAFIDKGNLAFFPVENSNGGSVTLALDLFPQQNFSFIAEHYQPINHTLLLPPNGSVKKIKNVFSHPQALAQCSNFLDTNRFHAVTDSDTAAAAKNVAERNVEGEACIGAEILADLYDLKVVKKNFQNSKDNTTRFVLAKKANKKYPTWEKKLHRKKSEQKTSLLFETGHIPGALYKCLGALTTNGINLTKIESRPLKGKNFHYFFYVEFEGSITEKRIQLALEELDFFTEKIKIFGSY